MNIKRKRDVTVLILYTKGLELIIHATKPIKVVILSTFISFFGSSQYQIFLL